MGGGEENLFNLLPGFPLLLVDKFYFELYLILFCLFRNPNIWLFCLSLIFNPPLSNVLSLMTTKYITFIELPALCIRCREWRCNMSGRYFFYSGFGKAINSVQKLQVFSLRVKTGHLLGSWGKNGNDGEKQTGLTVSHCKFLSFLSIHCPKCPFS